MAFPVLLLITPYKRITTAINLKYNQHKFLNHSILTISKTGKLAVVDCWRTFIYNLYTT